MSHPGRCHGIFKLNHRWILFPVCNQRLTRISAVLSFTKRLDFTSKVSVYSKSFHIPLILSDSNLKNFELISSNLYQFNIRPHTFTAFIDIATREYGWKEAICICDSDSGIVNPSQEVTLLKNKAHDYRFSIDRESLR